MIVSPQTDSIQKKKDKLLDVLVAKLANGYKRSEGVDNEINPPGYIGNDSKENAGVEHGPREASGSIAASNNSVSANRTTSKQGYLRGSLLSILYFISLRRVSYFMLFIWFNNIKYVWSLLQLYITVAFGKKRRNETTNLELICDPTLKNIDFDYTS